MSKKINTSGPSKGFIADPTITPFPINWNRLNKIRFEDAPTDYILLCKLAEKYNEIVEATNSLEEAMEQFIVWANENIHEITVEQLQEWLDDGTLSMLVNDKLSVYNTFNDVTDLNTVANSFIYICGGESIGDGAQGVYKIVDSNDNNILYQVSTNKYLLPVDNIYNIKKFGIFTCDIDISNKLQNIINFINNGIIYIPSGTYKLTNPVNVTKQVTIKGDGANKTILQCNNCNGFYIKENYISIENLQITLINKPAITIDIKNKVFGRAAIMSTMTDSINTGGLSLKNVWINGFSCGMVFNTEMTSDVWSGAYRNILDCIVKYNDYGMVLLDGITQSVINGGQFSNNDIHGLFVDTKNMYQNIFVTNCVFEINGDTSTINDKMNSGIFINNDSRVFFDLCYFEQTWIEVETNAYCSLINCYLKRNTCSVFGCGYIDIKNTNNPVTTLQWGVDLKDRCAGSSCTLEAYDSSPTIIVESNNNASVTVGFPSIQNTGLIVDDIDFIMFDCEYKLTSGQTATNFGLKPSFALVDFSSGNDSSTPNNFIALKNLNVKNSTHISCMYKPRVGGGRLTSGAYLYRISFNLYFTNTSTTDSINFSSDSLNIRIMQPKIRIITKSGCTVNLDGIYLKGLINT